MITKQEPALQREPATWLNPQLELRADVSKPESLLLRKEDILQDVESRERNFRKTKTTSENEGRKFRELLQKKKQKKRSRNWPPDGSGRLIETGRFFLIGPNDVSSDKA